MSGRARRSASIAAHAGRAAVRKVAGITARELARADGKIPVLMYHRVLADDAADQGIEPGMYVRASTFEKHVAWLAARYQLVTLADAVDAACSGRTRGLAVVTFDDGWRDNLTQAWPILEGHGARATIFLVGDWVARGRAGRGEFLSPADVRAMSEAGVEMGAHTMSHPKLDETPLDAIESELAASKAAVAAWTGRPCRTFAYPYGRFTEAAVASAARQFDAAVVVGGGWWNGAGQLAKIPRIAIHEDMTRWIPMFESRLAGAA